MTLHKILTALAVMVGVASCNVTSERHDATDIDSYAPILLDALGGDKVEFPLHETLELAGPETNLAGMSFFEQRIPANTAGAPPPHT